MPARKLKRKPLPFWVLFLIGLSVTVILGSFVFLVFHSVLSNKPVQTIKPPVTLTLAGSYTGNLPCADCPGIKETLTITPTNIAQTQGSYILEDLYLEKNTKPFVTQGTWTVINKNILELTANTTPSQPQYFLILGNGNLQMLDSNMQKIDFPFNQTLIKN